MKNQRGFTLIELIIVVIMVMMIPLAVATLWAGGSLITSAVKSGSQQCQQTTYCRRPETVLAARSSVHSSNTQKWHQAQALSVRKPQARKC